MRVVFGRRDPDCSGGQNVFWFIEAEGAFGRTRVNGDA